ncbi:hypothetical protein, partial [Pseudomonas putida]
SGNAVAFEVGIAVTFILASMGLPISLVIILPFLISSATQSKSMIASHPHSVFNATRYGFLVIAVFFYLPCLYYKWWLTPATILTLLIFIKRGKCIYISDSYTHYCKYFVFQMILMFSLISGAITFATGTEQWNWQTGGLLSLLSLLSALITHHLVSQIKIKPSPYEIRDNRVHFTSRRTTTINAVFWSGISASCAGVLEPLFQEHPRIVLIGSVLFPSIVVLAAWRTLAGLAQLKSEEKRKGVRYTFSNLEE